MSKNLIEDDAKARAKRMRPSAELRAQPEEAQAVIYDAWNANTSKQPIRPLRCPVYWKRGETRKPIQLLKVYDESAAMCLYTVAQLAFKKL